MKFRHQFQEKRPVSKGTYFYKESKTVPDQTISLRQLLINHTRGIPSAMATKEGVYFETEIPPITDLNDLEDYRQYVKSKQIDLEDMIKEVKQEQDRLIKAEQDLKSKEQIPE